MSIQSVERQRTFALDAFIASQSCTEKSGQFHGRSVTQAAADPALIALSRRMPKPLPTSPLSRYFVIEQVDRLPRTSRLAKAMYAGFLPASEMIRLQTTRINDASKNFLLILLLKFFALFGVLLNKPLHEKLMQAVDQYHCALLEARSAQGDAKEILNVLKLRVEELQSVVQSIHLGTRGKEIVALTREIGRELELIENLQKEFSTWPRYLSVVDALNMKRFSDLSLEQMGALARVGFVFDVEELCENVTIDYLREVRKFPRFKAMATEAREWMVSEIECFSEYLPKYLSGYREELFLLLLKNMHAGRRLAENAELAKRWIQAADDFKLPPEEAYKFFSARVPITQETIAVAKKDLTISWGKLGSGFVNSVYLGDGYCFAGNDQPRPAVFKPLNAVACDALHDLSQATFSGIEPDNPRIMGRNLASYRVNRLLGLDLIPITEFAMVNGRFCIVMEKAPGNLSYDVIQAGRMPLNDGKMYKALTQLQWLDALCAQTDRHQRNYLVDIGQDGRLLKITGVDNDISFGEFQETKCALRKNIGGENLGLPNVIDEDLAKTFSKLNEEILRSELAGLLTEKEVNAVVLRLNEIKNKIKPMEEVDNYSGSAGIIVRKDDGNEIEDGAWFDKNVNSLLRPQNPACKGGDTYVQRDIKNPI